MTATPDDPNVPDTNVPDTNVPDTNAPIQSEPADDWSAPTADSSTASTATLPAQSAWGAPDASYAMHHGAPTTTSAKAITSLVLSLVYLCGIGSAIAVVLGHLARGEIKRSGGRIGGMGLATAGLVLGYLGLAFTLVIGGVVALAALNDGVGTARQDSGQPSFTVPNDEAPPSEAPRQVAPAAGVCPDVAALADVTPTGTTLVLFNSTRGVEDGVVDCLYTDGGQPPAQAPYVLVAIQDDITSKSVDEYFEERSLDPPTSAQLGAAAGTADRFGFDSYDAPDSGLAYIDTAAARGERSVVLSVPASFEIDDEVLFVTTVALLDGIRSPDNVI